ncbi:MAG: RnfABCDGE type electron transport complex subunit B [bacterium]
MGPIWSSVISLGSMGLVFGLGLGVAARFLGVKVDPRVERVLEALPGSNCGACGYAGCTAAAEAIVGGKAEPNICAPGGELSARKIGQALGVSVQMKEKMIAKIRCAPLGLAEKRFEYFGVDDCRAAALVEGGWTKCTYACLGFGTCIKACKFDAIYIDDLGRVIIDEEKCTGCGMCVEICPRDVIEMVPQNNKVVVLCSSHDKGGFVRKVCDVGCTGCTICQKNCPEGAIHVADFLADIDYGKCTNCNICVEKCPQNTIVNRETYSPYVPKGEEAAKAAA